MLSCLLLWYKGLCKHITLDFQKTQVLKRLLKSMTAVQVLSHWNHIIQQFFQHIIPIQLFSF